MNWDAHIPVMCREAVSDYLKPVSGGAYLDGTIGIGGHAEAILEASSPDGRLLGCDRDPAQLAMRESDWRGSETGLHWSAAVSSGP